LFLKNKSPEEAFEWLDNLSGIGAKIAAFIVRDLQTIFNLWGIVAKDKEYIFQPVDVWVRDWASNIWTLNHLNDYNGLELMKEITQCCQNNNVSPSEYNKGAWFLGYHFQSICDFFVVKETERFNKIYCLLNYFDPIKLHDAIEVYVKTMPTRKQFYV
jgi:hypothetical protein